MTAHPLRWLDELGGDTSYGLRILRNRPGFTMAVVLSLALGIGANTAIFSLIDAVMWRTLPVERPEELWAVGDGYRFQEYRALAEDDAVLAGLAAYAGAPFNVSIDGSLEPTGRGSARLGRLLLAAGGDADRGSGDRPRRRSGPERAPSGDAQRRVLDPPVRPRPLDHRPCYLYFGHRVHGDWGHATRVLRCGGVE